MFSVLSAFATGIGLLTDKYMLEATNFVEHYGTDLAPSDTQSEFVKSAMYAGAIFGMVTFGPFSDIIGRRACLIACSVITPAGAVLSTCAWGANILILARIVTGIGMGGEYPLASTHSAESSDSGNRAKNIALLYLIASGGGPVLCDLVTYVLDYSGISDEYIWRSIFGFGALLAFIGLILRVLVTRNSEKFTEAVKAAKGTRRNFVRHYWKLLLGTALIWLLFDVVEYGLKQNDATIFSADTSGPYRDSVLAVLFTRLLVIPSLAFAPWILQRACTKDVQLAGFAGCLLINFALAHWYSSLKENTLLFDTFYICQLSFQSLPGVTTMAIAAEIYPSAVKGTGAAISAAAGKIGATAGSFIFTMLAERGAISTIFWTVATTAAMALVLTLCLTPRYNGLTIDMAETLADQGQTDKAVAMLYSGQQSPVDASAKNDVTWTVSDKTESPVVVAV
jgi:PHS family inorganic phosphate transporter-like MFS transporter